MNPNDIALIIEKELKMGDIDVLQMAEIEFPNAQPKTPTYIAQCIDNKELEAKEDAVVDSPNPNAAREVYKNAGPTYFYVQLSGIPTLSAKLIEDSKTFHKQLKAKSCKLKVIF